jgi:Spy/CpxP family protein refolding chaperone
MLFAPAWAGAQPGGPPPGPPGPPGHRGPPPIDQVLERHADRLGLSPDVRARVHQIAEQARAAEEPLREEVRQRHRELRALLDQDDPQLDAVMHKTEEISAAELALHQERLRAFLAVRQLLTPEQRRELVQIFEERRAQRRRHWHWDGGGGPPASAPPPGEPSGDED